MNFTLYTDGASRGNPGRAGAGYVIQDADGKPLSEGSISLGTQTNNYAEYEAAYLALVELEKMVPRAQRQSTEVEVRLDAELVQRQLTGQYQIRDDNLVPQYIKIHNLLIRSFHNTVFTHIPREQNRAADRLAKQATA